jgi:hypothetical protein
LIAVENALLLAAARRLFRDSNAPPLGLIRSLAYFAPVIDEVLDLKRKPKTQCHFEDASESTDYADYTDKNPQSAMQLSTS